MTKPIPDLAAKTGTDAHEQDQVFVVPWVYVLLGLSLAGWFVIVGLAWIVAVLV